MFPFSNFYLGNQNSSVKKSASRKEVNMILLICEKISEKIKEEPFVVHVATM